MLIEKEVASPGKTWYIDQKTGLPRVLDITPQLTKYWAEQGNAMLSSGLTVPVPYEHDFNAHPMTAKDKLLNNSGWVKEYRVKNAPDGRKDVLYSVLDIQDDEVAKKLPKTIRWTSPWINSFTDGKGKTWNNVISHVALTTRPRIVDQAPFNSIAAALSMATTTKLDPVVALEDFCFSKAGRLVIRKKDKKLRPQYPIAFSLYSGGIRLDEEEDGPGWLDEEGEEAEDETDNANEDADPNQNPLADQQGDVNLDVKMEELLCDILSVLGIPMPENVGPGEFKRALYEAGMKALKEMKDKKEASSDKNAADAAANTKSPGGNQPNPLIQQEQQPMYMSLDEIKKLDDGHLKTVALSMYNEIVKANTKAETNEKLLKSMRDKTLAEEQAKRKTRINVLGRMSPRIAADLAALEAQPQMALSMGEDGAVVDPMAQTLALLDKQLADMPKLFSTAVSDVTQQSQPADSGFMSEERSDELSNLLYKGPTEKRAS